MITKEELGALIKENMDANAFDILIQDCCEIICFDSQNIIKQSPLARISSPTGCFV